VLSDRDLVVLSDDFHGLPTSAIHIFRRLAQRNRVFWLNTVGRMPRPTLRDAVKVWRALGQMIVGSRSSAGNDSPVTVTSPMMVPWFRSPGRWFNAWSFQRTYHRLMAQHQLRDPIVITTFPFTADFVRSVDADLKVYYCVDDFLGYPGVDHRRWEQMEAELLDTVDGLAFTSRELERTRRRDLPTIHLPHGVDFDHYQSAQTTTPLLQGLATVPRPVVGFFGLVSEWFDVPLVEYLAKAFPQMTFVIVGQRRVDTTSLERLPNVRVTGWVPYAELPGIARLFDVGLIPYVHNRFTKSINPLKLLEYFALGLPVVATRLPELELVEGPVYLADTQEEFRRQLQIVLDMGPATRSDEAVSIARANTWDRRAEQFGEFLRNSGRKPTCEPSCI
jgi:glycosyltransferase involved in cell wall biosynthesis